MSDAVVLQDIGSENNGAVREHAFTLRGTDAASSECFVTIANETRLHREFATRMDYPPSTRFSVTDAELADYKDARAPKSKPGASASREDTGLDVGHLIKFHRVRRNSWRDALKTILATFGSSF